MDSRESLALALTVALSLGFYCWLLLKDPLIPGMDGPYYLIQAESILAGRGMEYPDPPLLFYLTAAASALLGDVRLGVCLTVALLTSLSAVPAFLLARRITGSLEAAAASALVLTLSPQLVRMAGDFMKNASSVLFLLSYLYLLHSAVEGGGEGEALAASASLLLAGLTHSLDFATALAYSACYLARSIRSGGVRRWALSTVPGVIALLGAALAMPENFSDVNKGINFLMDLAGVERGGGPRVPPRPERAWPLVTVGELWYPIFFASMGAALALDHARRGEGGRAHAAASSVAVAAFLALPTVLGLREWAFRFSLMEAVPASVIAGLAAGRAREAGARATVAAGLAALSAANALSMAARVHPLITWTQYQDLLAARGVVEPGLNASVACRMSPYWVQYVLGLRPFSRGGAQVVVWCPGERPPPRGVEVFRGREVSIYRVRP